ncbi:major facilitator superfamily MFS_1 [Candidatus Vecturithrix granuli]|uniref:Major facilitator superfamily MFS_1 n=1 Tax=Vecturithrix granuli TaxID=1499967 RepID=A0A081BUH0_VECG1|nr:major facilitator superfamily MFS_1 [Candidatus Vecturithrix granuli]
MDQRPKLHKNVILMGLTSFFTDVSSEMVYPLLQAFMSMVLASQKALLGPVLGIIEGIAESTASLGKVFFGYYSDRIQRRKMPTITGYSISALSKCLFFLASLGWYFVLLARFLDRVGKGVRTAPRDALISESVPKDIQGKAFGVQRAMDFAGATLGALLCYLISLHFLDPVTKTLKNLGSFYVLFIISIIPAIIGVVFLFFTQETGEKLSGKKARPKPNLDFRKYDRNLQRFFFTQFLFTLGNSSNQFLLLRSQDLGHTLSTVILMYLVFNLTSSLLSTFFGSLSDKIGRKRILVTGYLLYALVYMSFGFLNESSKSLLWGFWIIYGVYYAMTEGVEKAFVSSLAPTESKATALGFYHTIVGISLLPASLIAGLLFSWLPSAPFVFGGLMSLLATTVLGLSVRE